MLRHFKRNKRLKNDSSESAGSSASASRSKVFSVGLIPLYEPESAIVDIIFVHGLTGDLKKTWTSDDSEVPWPQELLPRKLTQARILTFGYDASVVDWRSMVSKNRIGSHSGNLLSAVATYREDDKTNDRPIIFVAHSLGGLVCEDALLASKNSADQHLQNILECTRGILFLGTPHSGSGFARWAELLAISIGFIKQTNAKILEVLKSDSEVLARIQTEFHTMIRDRTNKGQQPISITCFYEELPLPGVGEVVPMNSAILPAYISIGIHSDHMGMTKFEFERDPGFISVTGELRRWIKNLKPLLDPRKAEAPFLIPFDQDNHFIGRDDVIDDLDCKFETERRVALFGVGGIGKSQIAIEYCYRYREKNPRCSVFWVYSSTAERFNQAYKDIARRLNLPGWNDPGANTLQIVSDWLVDGTHENWLMVLDNADDEDTFFGLQKKESSEGDHRYQQTAPLSAYVPQTSRGSILITSRNRKVAFSLTANRAERIVDVPRMGMESAVDLLNKKLPDNQSNDQNKEDLVTILEHLPLAITQAAAYMSVRNTTMTISEYLTHFERILMEDMKDLRRDPSVPNSALITWQITFDQIKKNNPRAAETLSLISMLDRQGIPKFLFSNDDNWEFENAIGLLIDFSLVIIETGGKSFGIHRLVQLATKKWLELHDETKKWEQEAITLISNSFPDVKYENWKQCRVLLPHADAVSEYQNLDQNHSLQQAELLYNMAVYSWTQGDSNISFARNQSALNIYYEFRDGKSENFLDCLELDAVIKTDQRKFDEAEQVLRRILYVIQKNFEVNSPKMLFPRTRLAKVFYHQRKYDEAEKIHREILSMKLKLLGLKHSDTLFSMSLLASTMEAQKKYDEAEKMHRKVLNIRCKFWGLKHPDTLDSMSNLASTLLEQKKYDDAENLSRRTFNLYETVVGKTHSDTLNSMHNLGLALDQQAKYDEAEITFRRVLALRETVMGKTHPDTLKSMHNLGLALNGQEKHDEAEITLRRVLVLRETVMGKTHSDTLDSMNNLGLALCGQGKHDEAEITFRRLLILDETMLGETHPETLISMDNLRITLENQGKLNEAEEIWEQYQKRKARASEVAVENEKPDEIVEAGATSSRGGIIPSDEELEEIDYADLLEQLSKEMAESQIE